MGIILSHQSALEVWRHPDSWALIDANREPRLAVPNEYPSLEKLNELAQRTRPLAHLLECAENGAGALHVLVRDQQLRNVSKLVYSHVCTLDLPPESLVKLADEVYVASPELCFLQMCQVLPRIDCIELAYELCGVYMTGPEFEDGFADQPAVTSVAKLQEYLARVESIPGAQRAYGATRYALDGARSPQEAALSMTLSLPTRLGGYGIPAPQLNHTLQVPHALQNRYTRRSEIECDLYWPGLDVEYNSDQDHAQSAQRARDANRAIVLEKMGVQHIQVTRLQMKRSDEFEFIVRKIRDHLGLRHRAVPAQRRAQRQRLRSYLMTPAFVRAEVFADWMAEFDGRLR